MVQPKAELIALKLGNIPGVGDYYHLAMQVTLANGQTYIAEGGPERQAGNISSALGSDAARRAGAPSSGSPFGRLRADVRPGPYNEPGARVIATVNLTDASARELVQDLDVKMRYVDGAVDYWPTGPNSNFIGSVWQEMRLGNINGILRNQGVNAPGVHSPVSRQRASLDSVPGENPSSVAVANPPEATSPSDNRSPNSGALQPGQLYALALNTLDPKLDPSKIETTHDLDVAVLLRAAGQENGDITEAIASSPVVSGLESFKRLEYAASVIQSAEFIESAQTQRTVASNQVELV
jgi:hypothetical protein